jgi:hypothetical protein
MLPLELLLLLELMMVMRERMMLHRVRRQLLVDVPHTRRTP